MTNISAKFKDVLRLTKFDIIVFEMITIAAGYFIGLPLEMPVDWMHFFLTFFGISFLALGSGALNQIQEHKEDLQMARTRDRPLPSGRISMRFATILVITLFSLGVAMLTQISTTVLVLGIFAVISYNILYTMWWKRRMAFAAIPGAIPGALPILIGFESVTHNVLDVRGWYLFAILFFWQMPHFWVLALKYSNDYDQGGFPTLPVAHGSQVTRFQITLWCLAYAGIGLLSALFFPIGVIGLAGALAVSLWLIYELIRFLKHPEQKTWLRFFLSINFSLLLYLGVIVFDLWSIHLHPTT